jgi:hypothetical protein
MFLVINNKERKTGVEPAALSLGSRLSRDYQLMLPHLTMLTITTKQTTTQSGRRESNPRPSAWEADALPTELLPLFYTSH